MGSVLRDIVAAISRAKDELTDPARYRALAQTMLEHAADDEAREAAEQALEVAQVYEVYEQALRARRAVDFGDLVMRPALLSKWMNGAGCRPPTASTRAGRRIPGREPREWPAFTCLSPATADASGSSATPGSPSIAFAARPRRT